MIAFVLIVAGIIAGATVALGFAGYFSFMFGTDRLLTALVLVVLLSLISFKGMKESTILTIVSTVAEVGGLLLVIVLGLPFIGNATTDYFSSPAGITSILGGISLIFFAYIGFEDVANISEDTKNAAKVVPKALLISIAVTTVLYIIVSVAAVSVIGAEGLAASKAPLASVVSAAYNESLVGLMTIIALFATGNTVLIILIVVSRILFGLAKQGVMPSLLGRVHRRTRTPYIAVFAVMVIAMAALLLGDIRTIASLTDIGIFIAYLAVNLSLIRVRYREKTKPAFRAPVNIGRFPVLALLGAVSSVIMLTVFPLQIVLMEAGVIVAGFLLYEVMKKEHLITNKKYISE